jgi:hypothetical protein
MNLSQACLNIIAQLRDLTNQIEPNDFSKPSAALSNSTLGQHMRHTLEFFCCFERGFSSGVINYDKRDHSKTIENDKFVALDALNKITDFIIEISDQEKSMKLEVGYDLKKEEYITIETNAMRELVYNIEHAVHHMAIMKIGVREIASYIKLPQDFGIAASTVRYKENEEHQTHS